MVRADEIKSKFPIKPGYTELDGTEPQGTLMFDRITEYEHTVERFETFETFEPDIGMVDQLHVEFDTSDLGCMVTEACWFMKKL